MTSTAAAPPTLADHILELVGAIAGLATLAAVFCLGWNEFGFAHAIGADRIAFVAVFGGAIALASAVRVVVGPTED